jgi:hypothetical protein
MERKVVMCIEIDVGSSLEVANVYVVRTNPRTGGATRRMYRTDALRLFRALADIASACRSARSADDEVEHRPESA